MDGVTKTNLLELSQSEIDRLYDVAIARQALGIFNSVWVEYKCMNCDIATDWSVLRDTKRLKAERARKMCTNCGHGLSVPHVLKEFT